MTYLFIKQHYNKYKLNQQQLPTSLQSKVVLVSLCSGLEPVPDVFGGCHEATEDDADEQDHEDAADVLQVELTHRRRALVLLQRST